MLRGGDEFMVLRSFTSLLYNLMVKFRFGDDTVIYFFIVNDNTLSL